MYWPLGAPKIYAAHRRRRKAQDDGGEEDQDSQSEKQDEALIGLQVSRQGRRFTTITETTLSVWQTSVSSGEWVANWF